MSETCEQKNNVTVKELMCANYEMLNDLYRKLNAISFDIDGQEGTAVVEQNPMGLIEALKEQNDLIRFCCDYATKIKDQMG